MAYKRAIKGDNTQMSKSHTYHVLNDTIKLLEYSNKPVELILSAIFHDIGNKLCKLRKIVESEIEQSNNKEQLKELAYAYRIEHQFWGMLETIKVLKLIGFKADTILNVVEMVGRHDLWKVIDIDLNNDEELLREADVHWMLTDDGIKRDIERAKENGLEPMTKEKQYEWNKGLIGHLITHLD